MCISSNEVLKLHTIEHRGAAKSTKLPQVHQKCIIPKSPPPAAKLHAVQGTIHLNPIIYIHNITGSIMHSLTPDTQEIIIEVFFTKQCIRITPYWHISKNDKERKCLCTQ